MRINFSELGNAILLEILNRAIETKHNVAAGLHLWFQLLSIVCSKKSRFHVHVVHSFGIPMLYCTAHACTALSAKSASNPPRSSESCHAQPTNVIPRNSHKAHGRWYGGQACCQAIYHIHRRDNVWCIHYRETDPRFHECFSSPMI